MFAPGAADLMADFHTTSAILGTLSVSMILLGYALGPLILAPMSELYGRLIIYHITNVVFFAFIVGCAASSNLASFMVFRFISGAAGSAPQTIGGGTIADVIPQEKRGAAMAIYTLGPMFGPVMGPIMGGFITQGAGWRWTFWLIAILVGSCDLF